MVTLEIGPRVRIAIGPPIAEYRVRLSLRIDGEDAVD